MRFSPHPSVFFRAASGSASVLSSASGSHFARCAIGCKIRKGVTRRADCVWNLSPFVKLLLHSNLLNQKRAQALCVLAPPTRHQHEPLHRYQLECPFTGSVRTVFMQLTRCALVFSFMWALATSTEPSLSLDRNNTHQLGSWPYQNATIGTTYSVIVVRQNARPSSQLQDQTRFRFFSRTLEGIGRVWVQFAKPGRTRWRSGEAPFRVVHRDGVDKRVRIVFVDDVLDARKQVSDATVTYFTRSHPCAEGNRSCLDLMVVNFDCLRSGSHTSGGFRKPLMSSP